MSQHENSLGSIARAALVERDLSALEAMLQSVAALCGAIGAVLWQLRIYGEASAVENLEMHSRPATEADLANLPRDRARLFTLAQGFLDPSVFCTYHDLPLSIRSGEAILKGEAQSLDCTTDETIQRETEFIRTANPGSLFAVKHVYGDGTIGALTIYRRQTGELDDKAKERVRQIAREDLATLYAAIFDRVNYSLVLATSQCLDRAGENESFDPMQCIADAIAQNLKCVEASIFLENGQEDVDRFELRATSCPDFTFRKSFDRSGPGLTPLVASSQRPVLVFDLRSVPEYLREGARFERDDKIEARVRDMLNVPQGFETPPMSFVAVPILAGPRTIGVLRCHLRPRTPHYFSESDVVLLGIIAARIGSYWSRDLRQQEHKITNGLWEQFVSDLNKLELHQRDLAVPGKRVRVNRELQEDFSLQALAALKNAIRGVDILDVALVDADRRHIQQIVMTDGRRQLRASQTPAPGLTRLTLNPAMDNSWAFIFHEVTRSPYSSQSTFFIPDTAKREMPYREMYPGVKQAIFAPIVADNQCVGILSLRSKAHFRDPDKARSMASLVALQVALYHQLLAVLSQQARTYHDMGHQLRTPVFQVRKRIRWLVERSENPSYDLRAVNGLMAKTQRVLGNMRLYEELAGDARITVRKASHQIDALIKLLYEACVDNEALWASKSIAFRPERDTFQRLPISTIQYDSALLEQVVNNLLDNAGKYGRQGGEVTVSGRLDQSSRMVDIVFRNPAGVRIEKNELEHIGERGYRSEKAVHRTTEGSGIGLYLAKRIMEAHKGEVVVSETDPLGDNRIAIRIPY